MEMIQELIQLVPRNLNDLADFIYDVKMSPVFICLHYCLVALSLRKRPGAVDYAKEHPFPSLFVCVTSCFGGTLIMNFLLGRPIIMIYTNTQNVLLASLLWYLVLFSPFDVVAKVTQIKLVKAVMLSLKEVHRIHMILDGVNITSKLYPGNILNIVLIGSVKGSGAKFLLRPIDNFIRGDIISDNEFLCPSFSTKHSVVCSILLYFVRNGVLNMDERQLVCVLVLTAALVQVLMLLTDIHDPYERVESLVCTVLLKLPKEITEKDDKKKTD